ncbi:hypothetical protein [Deferrisoma palaeochoriense]
MARILLCSRCYAIRGCENGRTRHCERCTAHDCPLLPAPTVAAGECPACRGADSIPPDPASPETYPSPRAGRA